MYKYKVWESVLYNWEDDNFCNGETYKISAINWSSNPYEIDDNKWNIILVNEDLLDSYFTREDEWSVLVYGYNDEILSKTDFIDEYWEEKYNLLNNTDLITIGYWKFSNTDEDFEIQAILI